MKKGDIIELEISKYAFEGKGIAKVEKSLIVPGTEKKVEVEINSDADYDELTSDKDQKNYVIFVHGSYPGDRVKAMITKIKKSYAEAKTVEVLSASEERTKAPCKYFGVCGGCKQQDLSYGAQLKYKQEQVKDIFERLGGFHDFEFQEILPSEKTFFYRNKMEYSFAERRWLTKDELGDENVERNFALGLHLPNIFDKVLDINECLLQSEESNAILNFTRDFFKKRNTTIYSTKTHSGYLRNLIIRKTHHSSDLMVNLVTSEENDSLMKEYTEGLLKAVPEVTTVINNINTKKAQIAVGDYEIVYFGTGNIYDTIGKYNFRISANSFFQTNTLQAEKLYHTGLKFGKITKDDVVYDLYSGAGTISIYVSESAKKVYAFETVEPAVKDAEENRKMNKIDNVKFITADLNRSFLDVVKIKGLPSPDVVILDPPRSGMNPVTVKDVVALDPDRIVYISCNPATQVRDIKMFNEEGYRLMKVRPVDMFPHTYHIENVALLEK
ncbi:MAG: 23S rRNA (uracil(1939)-C(5))-methyltransferase RlmD [Bacteroidota bacterium]|nr:23S rRNA (uracil(1939)-C(5))-methyltransferase RlmD [Ignavibacteria bacterium]MCU7513796.1 23S rRNA (uracil(1939)-C(5))-methyltransferase RlmD [Ignavibacteria bacterium]